MQSIIYMAVSPFLSVVFCVFSPLFSCFYYTYKQGSFQGEVFPDVRSRIVGVENRRIFGYYIGENGKKSGTFIRAIGALV